MKKVMTVTALAMFSVSAFAQFEMKLTKQEFIDQQIKLFEYVDQLRAQAPEVEVDEDQDKAVQECLGLSSSEVKALESKMTGSALIEGVKSCSSKLPDNIVLNDMDWSKNADLADFNECNEAFIAKKVGVPLDKFKRCTAESEEEAF